MKITKAMLESPVILNGGRFNIVFDKTLMCPRYSICPKSLRTAIVDDLLPESSGELKIQVYFSRDDDSGRYKITIKATCDLRVAITGATSESLGALEDYFGVSAPLFFMEGQNQDSDIVK